MKPILLTLVALLLAGDPRSLRRAPRASSSAAADDLRVLQVQPNFYMISGAGANIAVQKGEDGLVVVDAGAAPIAARVVAAIKAISDRPIRYIINTSADAEHVGGNEVLAKAGQSLFPSGDPGAGIGAGGGGGVANAMSNGGSASIIASENVLLRMSAPTGQQAPYPSSAWPTETYTQKQKNLYLNHEGIQVMHQPGAHSDGDSIVFFRRSDVIVTGDIFDLTRFPVIDVDKGGSIQGEIDALNRIVELAIPPIPLPFQDGGTYIVPGHGRICEQAEVVEYRDMVTILRDVIEDMKSRGMTLEQVTAAAPTRGYARRYGSDSGPWTTNNFVEAVYRSLPTKKPGA